jgi:hypothetical protein
MTAQLLPLFSPPPFLTAFLPLVSDPRTKSDRNYSSTTQHNNALSLTLSLPISLSLSLTPIPAFHHGTSTKSNCSTSHAYEICQLTNGRAD